MVANPPDEKFKEIVIVSSLKNLPVEVKEVSNSYVIFGANHNRLRGESTRQKPKMIKEQYMKIPKDFYQLHKFVTLTAHSMFVNDIPYLVTFSQNTRLDTFIYIPTCTEGKLAKSVMKILKFYARCGFITRLVLMDIDFEKVKYKVSLLGFNTTASQEHVAEIEIKIRLIKDRTRCSISDMLECGIKYLHNHIVIHIVYNVCLWINTFPLKSGLSMEYSPREIFTQKPVE